MDEQPESLESKQFFLVVAVLESFGRSFHYLSHISVIFVILEDC